jgi:hypothetical protein
MSDSTYNIIVPVPQDPNTYSVNDIQIEFVKDYKLQYNEIYTNMTYSYAPLLNTDGVYPVVEFTRKDPNGYIKLKGKDLFLHQRGDQLFFDIIRDGLFSARQPLVLFFEYVREGEFIIYTLAGPQLNALMKTVNDGVSNVKYLHYAEKNGKIFMNWQSNVNNATKMHYNRINWSEFGWIKAQDKEAQRKIKNSNKY